MGYLHIDNLYKNQAILMMKECYALEKIHGTSAHISYKAKRVDRPKSSLAFSAGGGSYDNKLWRKTFLPCVKTTVQTLKNAEMQFKVLY